jgi:ubiquinone/menaquinone biosynthesis C-methylase UbiE
MPDVYATIAQADLALQERLADVIELRANDPCYQEMVHAYLATVPWKQGNRVLEVGCGTGFICRIVAKRREVGGVVGIDPSPVLGVVGIDPSPVFIERARILAADLPSVSFECADGRSLPCSAASFDGVVLNTTLSHVPQPEQIISEANRVLRTGGWLAIFDGDYATATVATHVVDPLQTCVQAFLSGFVHDPWLMRRLPRVINGAGFADAPMRSHGYVEAPQAGYMLTWIDRGADALVTAGCIDSSTAESLKAEGRRRSDASEWFGYIAFASMIAIKAGDMPTQ